MYAGIPGSVLQRNIIRREQFLRDMQTPKSEDGKQSFQRRIQNRYVSVGNEWVVPYDPELLRLFDTHINVEIVLSM